MERHDDVVWRNPGEGRELNIVDVEGLRWSLRDTRCNVKRFVLQGSLMKSRCRYGGQNTKAVK